MSSSTEALEGADFLKITYVLSRNWEKGTKKRFIQVTMKDGKKYKIKTTALMNELRDREEALKQSVSDLEKEIVALQKSAQSTANTLREVKILYDERKAEIEEARKELETKEKGLVAAQKEAKKRGRPVSPATMVALDNLRHRVNELMKPGFRSFADTSENMERLEAEIADKSQSMERLRDQIAQMSAEKDSIRARIESLVIESMRDAEKAEIDYDM